MKRPASSDSLGGLISMCPSSTDEKNSRVNKKNNFEYSKGFQSMLDGLDEEDCGEELGLVNEKKRRLSVDQVKSLEKSFEVENKLEPDRKMKLAQELGLQPRQVAIWFQNRRARWKTKQLEIDYGHLKANYDALKLNFDALRHEKEDLLSEVNKLRSKLQGETPESNLTVKEEETEIPVEESENRVVDQTKTNSDEISPNQECDNNKNCSKNGDGVYVYNDYKYVSSDSDSSAILSEGYSPMFDQLYAPRTISTSILRDSDQHQFVKLEEHNFLGAPCDFFTEDQAPSVPWYCPDQWN
ncbi:hypothetical protein GIB67_042983 [Kingdonia uniflora]|uniref:Homeobox-leucine zipper protein n=1 Tax=Kingdonia uniflora TaxID=39325 RepID=A0A7J7NT70_9MAGN|nr:hypothetical protein GIB67_042983 [Kingdonia uniflora]